MRFPYYRDYPHPLTYMLLNAALAVSYASAWLLWEHPVIAAVPVALTGVLLLAYFRSIKLAVVYAVFAAGGAWHEAYFIGHGLWHYGAPSYSGIPFYLPFVWGNIGILAVGALHVFLHFRERWHLYHRPPGFVRGAAATIVGVLVALWLIRHHANTPIVLAGYLLLVDLAYVTIMRSVPLALVGFFALLGGGVGDLVSVAIGVWGYPTSTLAGIPLYIFIGWDVIGLFIAGTYLTLDAPGSPLAHAGTTA